MKVLNVSAILSFILTIALSLVGCNKEDYFTSRDFQKKAAPVIVADPCEVNCLLNAPGDLSESEEVMLLKMREEEKLARDVYLTLSESFNLPVFTNIPTSEQIHMDRVLCLLDHFQMDDPASPIVGEFSDTDIQELYNAFVSQGEISLIGALDVGASIEDLIINDLNILLGQTENVAIITIFENLLCGSENHLRSFFELLNKRGVEYIPEYITQDELNAIIGDDHLICVLD